MRLLVHGCAVAILVSAGAVVAISSPAAAINCDITRSGLATSTIVYNTSGATKCYRVRARIDRYYAGSPVTVLGDIDAVSSVASNSNGTLIGHYSNKSLWNGSSQIWDGWSSF